jgi:hypothetical protein
MILQERVLGFLLGIGFGAAIGFFLRATEGPLLRVQRK